MDTDANERLERREEKILGSLLAGPVDAGRRFLAGGLTAGQLYGNADGIGRLIKSVPDAAGPLCLCAGERSFVAAALLAALQEGIPLLIPYAFDAKTLNAAWQVMPFAYALAEGDDSLPDGVTAITDQGPDNRPLQATPSSPLAWNRPWLYLFTGGSTGTPQIWSKTPRNLLMEAVYLADTFGITRSDTILATVPTNHIYGLLYSVLLPLVSGASVCPATPSFPNEITDDLEATRATVLVSIPAHYRAIKEAPIPQHQVRLAFSSAGALPEQDAVDFYGATGIAITEIYGSTETGGIARRTRAKGQTALHPFECAEVRIENQHLQVRSPFLSNELPKSSDEFFETADRAQWTDPPAFALLGRSDGIVKVGGKRVDLAVIKEVLMEVNGVCDVYVFAQPVESGRENEILTLVEGTATIDLLKEAANRLLPPYAHPRSIRVTQQMPVTSTGKYHRNAIEDFFK